MQCKKCNKKADKLYTYKCDAGIIYEDICWHCYNRLMDIGMETAEIIEERNTVHFNEQCESEEEYRYKVENKWI